MIVLSEEVKNIAKEDSCIFGGNLSAYLTHLILNARKEKKTSNTAKIGNDNEITAPVVVGSKNKVNSKTKK